MILLFFFSLLFIFSDVQKKNSKWFISRRKSARFEEKSSSFLREFTNPEKTKMFTSLKQILFFDSTEEIYKKTFLLFELCKFGNLQKILFFHCTKFGQLNITSFDFRYIIFAENTLYIFLISVNCEDLHVLENKFQCKETSKFLSKEKIY